MNCHPLQNILLFFDIISKIGPTHINPCVLALNVLSTQASAHGILGIPLLRSISLCDCRPASQLSYTSHMVSAGLPWYTSCLSLGCHHVPRHPSPGTAQKCWRRKHLAHPKPFNKKCTSVLSHCCGIHVCLRKIFPD
jgi:hypothetical protein